MQRGQELSFSSLILFLPTETMTSWVRHPSLLMVFSCEMCVFTIFFFYSSSMKMMMTTLLLSSSYGLLLWRKWRWHALLSLFSFSTFLLQRRQWLSSFSYSYCDFVGVKMMTSLVHCVLMLFYKWEEMMISSATIHRHTGVLLQAQKKWQWTTMFLIIIVVWFCKSKKMMINNTIVHHHYGVVLQVQKNNNNINLVWSYRCKKITNYLSLF